MNVELLAPAGSMEALKTAGYDARISCEAYTPNGFDQDAETAMKFFKELLGK